jgi:exodeoxyribonuclease V alpha subunit
MDSIITMTLNTIRYQNGNGFVILVCSAPNSKKSFSCLGNMNNPVEGMEYQLSGKWSNHPDFGKQFKFDSYTPVKPSDTNGIYKYLVRTVKWVGPIMAERLINIYGDETLDVLREDPEMVAAEIQGLTEKKALEIQETLIENEQIETVLVELMKILDIPGLRKSLPTELIRKYGLNAADKLRKNPYIIINFQGSGFMIADRLAMHVLNISNNSMFRIKAAVKYAMEQDLHTGNVWITRQDLYFTVKELIGDLKEIDDGIDELLISEVIVDAPGLNNWLAFAKMDEDETYISTTIKGML